MKNLERYLISAVFLLVITSCAETEMKYGMKVIGKIEPKNSSEITDSYWGIQASTQDKDLLKRMTEIGVKWTRLEARWPEIEKHRAVYDFTGTDAAIATTLENSITPFVTLGGGNKLYVPLTTYSDPALAAIYGYKPAPPVASDSAMNAWLKFVAATVERYRDRIRYWEIWNEPNHRNYWGMEPDGTDYGYLVRETSKVIKEIQPGAIILAGSMAGIDPEFLDEFLSGGTHSYVDVVTYHNYGAIPEIRIYPAQEAWQVINKYKPELELWQGECGYPSHSSTRDYRGVAPWGLNIQGKWLLRQAFTDVYFCDATLSNYFKLVHGTGFGEKPVRENLSALDSILGYPERDGSRIKTVGVNEKCLLTSQGYEPKPAFFSYQNLCAVVDKSYKKTKNKFTVHIRDQGVFYGIGPFDDGFPSQTLVAQFINENNQPLIAYWLPWQPQENIAREARISLFLENTSFARPVLIDLLSGEVLDITLYSGPGKQTEFPDLPLLDYPMVIAEKDQIRLAD